MCNRESFILLPMETGIPVAWTTSYHHEDIVAHLKRTGFYFANDHPAAVQIECLGGNILRWDWDNTPKTKRYIVPPQKAQWKPITPDYEASFTNIEIEEVPDIPHWLEDNLHTYENKVEKILERLNPLRDRWERLRFSVVRNFNTPNCAADLEVVLTQTYIYDSHSPEVKEFEAIINGYKEIEGFVHSTYAQKGG